MSYEDPKLQDEVEAMEELPEARKRYPAVATAGAFVALAIASAAATMVFNL